jgi:peptide/nickel transport system substrate-binding protein
MWHSNEKKIRGECMKKAAFIKSAVFLVFVLFLFSTALSIAAETKKPAPAQKTTAPAKAEKPKYGGTLRISDISDGASLGYPAKILRTDANRQGGTAIETLLRYDSSVKLVPWLATNYKENAKDKNIVLTLRKGVKFHDGTDFNGEAVKWNLEQFIAAKSPSAKNIASIDVVDQDTVRINLSEWDSTTISNFAAQMGMMISPTACKKNGPEWAAAHPVGTGPFEFVSWEKDTATTFKKFNGYWQKGKPYLDGVKWTNIADPLTREMALKSGELDVAIILDSQNIKKLENDGFVNSRIGQSGASTLVPDSKNPNSPWSKLKVRQAAQYAIDTEAIARDVWKGEAQPGKQWVYKGHWGYNPAVKGYPYNPAKARQLLTEAGYPNGFKTKLTYQKGFYELGVIAAQGYLKAVGIDMELDGTQPGRWNTLAMGGNWDGLIFGSASGDPELLALMDVRMSGIGNWYKSTEFPADYTAVIKKAIAAPDFKTKQKLVWDVQKLMVDKYCISIMLWCMMSPATEAPYVKNSNFFRLSHNGLWTPEEVWLAK